MLKETVVIAIVIVLIDFLSFFFTVISTNTSSNICIDEEEIIAFAHVFLIPIARMISYLLQRILGMLIIA